MEPLIPRRRKKRKGRHRGMSLEDISREDELTPIHDVHSLALDPFAVGVVQEDEEVESPVPSQLITTSPSIPSDKLSIDSVEFDAVYEEIENELTPQYEASRIRDGTNPNTNPNPNLITNINNKSHRGGGRTRSDSHFNSSAPLIVKKYTNNQLHDVINQKRPQLLHSHELPKLDSVSDADLKIQTLLHKLKLCEVPCDFRLEGVPDDEHKVIANKSLLLQECEQYITKSTWSSVAVLEQIFRIVQIHLFRSLPDVCIIEEVRGVDKPSIFTLPSWMHLMSIYEMFFQVLGNTQFEKRVLIQYLSGSFLNSFVSLFHSREQREINYVKILLHSMYSDFPSLRDELRISISQYIWCYVYEDRGTAHGINACLELMNSILKGLDDERLNDPQQWYIVLCHVLCPLHKGKGFDTFEKTLYQCFQTFIKSRPEHFVVVLNYGLFRFWPLTNPNKEQLFLKAINFVLNKVKRPWRVLKKERFHDIFQAVIGRIRKSLGSTHYKIVEETIECLNEDLLRKCIDDHGGEDGWTQIYKSLIYVAKANYYATTREKGESTMQSLKEDDFAKKYRTSFEKLDNEYHPKPGEPPPDRLQSEQRKMQRQQRWKSIIAMAEAAGPRRHTNPDSRPSPPSYQRQSTRDHIEELLADFDDAMTDQIETNGDGDSENEIECIEIEIERNQNERENGDIDGNGNGDGDGDGDRDEVVDDGNEQKEDEAPAELSLFANSSTMKPSYLMSSENTRPRHQAVFSGPMPNVNTATKPVQKRRGSATENDYGYPAVHAAFNKYREQKGINCGNSTHLVLFAKKVGVNGVNFQKSEKYFNARRVASRMKAMNRIGGTSAASPTSPILSPKKAIHAKRNSLRRHHNVAYRAPPPAYPAPRSPPNQILPTTSRVKFFESRDNEAKESPKDVNYGLDLRWSTLDVGSPRLVAKQPSAEKEKAMLEVMELAETMEIAEDMEDVMVSPEEETLLQSPLTLNQSQSIALPGALKSSPSTAASTYWSALGQNMNIDSLRANDITLK